MTRSEGIRVDEAAFLLGEVLHLSVEFAWMKGVLVDGITAARIGGEFLDEVVLVRLHVARRRQEVVVLVTVECSAQTTNLEDKKTSQLDM